MSFDVFRNFIKSLTNLAFAPLSIGAANSRRANAHFQSGSFFAALKRMHFFTLEILTLAKWPTN